MLEFSSSFHLRSWVVCCAIESSSNLQANEPRNLRRWRERTWDVRQPPRQRRLHLTVCLQLYVIPAQPSTAWKRRGRALGRVSNAAGGSLRAPDTLEAPQVGRVLGVEVVHGALLDAVHGLAHMRLRVPVIPASARASTLKPWGGFG